MRFATTSGVLTLALLLALPAETPARRLTFTDTFDLARCNFNTRGRNPYFILIPGHQLVLEGEDKGEVTRVVITVLDETLTVDGVDTRVVEEVETVDGALVEKSRNFFAVCSQTETVFYFGEDVDIYENGAIVSHDGAWRAGVDGARPGVIMPGINLVGARYYQEVAPEVALDRAETISVTETLTTPAGRFVNVLKTKETTPLEKGKGFKFYAPDVGMIQDSHIQLISFTAK